jgi:hypothetical protein
LSASTPTPDSQVGLATARLVEALRRTDLDPRTGAIIGTGAADLLRHADLSRPFWISFSPSNGPYLRLYAKDGNGGAVDIL